MKFVRDHPLKLIVLALILGFWAGSHSPSDSRESLLENLTLNEVYIRTVDTESGEIIDVPFGIASPPSTEGTLPAMLTDLGKGEARITWIDAYTEKSTPHAGGEEYEQIEIRNPFPQKGISVSKEGEPQIIKLKKAQPGSSYNSD